MPHRRTAQCTRGAERKRQKLAAEEEREFTARYFSAYGCPLDMVTYFKYLGRVISAAEDYWLAVAKNLSRTRKVWIRMLRILSREGAAPRVSRLFFKAVVQAVLIFGAETWVVTPHTSKALGGFQTQVARRLTGRLPRRIPDRKWRYKLVEAAKEEAVFLMMEEYIRQRKNTVAHYIATQSLLDLCEGSERAPGAQVGMRWQE